MITQTSLFRPIHAIILYIEVVRSFKAVIESVVGGMSFHSSVLQWPALDRQTLLGLSPQIKYMYI